MKRIISMSLVLALAIIFTTILGGCGKVDVEDITLSDKSVKLQLKDKFELSATVTPKNAAEPMVYWDTSDSSVVTVKSGVLTAVGEGKATVKAFTSNGVSDECKVTVDNVLASKLTLNKSKFTLMLGATENLFYTITPKNVTNNSIEWESSNTKVATVENGKVTGKDAGECTITATSSNGLKAKCKVIVKVKPTGVVINKHSVNVGTNKSIQLSATVKPNNTAYKDVMWESSNESIATVDSKGKVIGKKVGSCKIYATTKNNKYDYCKVIVTQEDLKFSGNGNKTLSNVTVTKGVYAITMTHEGKGTFTVIGSDGDGRVYTYADTTGKYTGTNLYAKGKSDGVEDATIKVAATGKWTIKIKAITYDGTDNITGSGECVSKMFTGTDNKQTVKLKNKGDDDFTVFLFDETGKQIGVLCDEIDDYEGTVSATLNKNKSYFIVVKSSGTWSVDFGSGSKVTTVKNTN